MALVQAGAPRGLVYVCLHGLEHDGWVRSCDSGETDITGRIKRYEYQITSVGRAALLRDDL